MPNLPCPFCLAKVTVCKFFPLQNCWLKILLKPLPQTKNTPFKYMFHHARLTWSCLGNGTMCVHSCACVCECVPVCVHVHVHVYMCVHVCACTFVCVHVRVCVWLAGAEEEEGKRDSRWGLSLVTLYTLGLLGCFSQWASVCNIFFISKKCSKRSSPPLKTKDTEYPYPWLSLAQILGCRSLNSAFFSSWFESLISTVIHSYIYLTFQRLVIKPATAQTDPAVQPHQAVGQASPQLGNMSENHLTSWNGLSWLCALVVRKGEGEIIKGRAWQRGRGKEHIKEKGRQPIMCCLESSLCGLVGSGQSKSSC